MNASTLPRPRGRLHRVLRLGRRLLLLAGLAALTILSLFAWVGLRRGWQRPPVDFVLEAEAGTYDGELTLVALNLAKLDFHAGRLDFVPAHRLAQRIERVAQALTKIDPDVVCLSEVVEAGGTVRFDQARALAETAGYRYRIYVANYDFGLPLLRVSSGNAVLSRYPLREARGQQLAGGKPFWAPTNNRRALWCEIELSDTWLPLASIRNDSFDLTNNARQVKELLAVLDGRPALVAGDFNATPDSQPGRLWRAAEQLGALESGPPTYPAAAPNRRIDDAVWPASWELVEHGVLDTGVSDHLGVWFRWRVGE